MFDHNSSGNRIYCSPSRFYGYLSQNVSKQTQLHLLPGEIFYMTQRLALRTIKNKMLNFVREIQKKG